MKVALPELVFGEDVFREERILLHVQRPGGAYQAVLLPRLPEAPPLLPAAQPPLLPAVRPQLLPAAHSQLLQAVAANVSRKDGIGLLWLDAIGLVRGIVSFLKWKSFIEDP